MHLHSPRLSLPGALVVEAGHVPPGWEGEGEEKEGEEERQQKEAGMGMAEEPERQGLRAVGARQWWEQERESVGQLPAAGLWTGCLVISGPAR
jgi:hypothetical protein